MTFKYKEETTKYEYEIKFLDKADDVVTTYITAYSDKQALYKMKHLRNDVVRVIEINKLREIPDGQGKQLEMDI